MKNSILSYKLKEYRELNSLTQLDLAEILEVSDKSISKWELGEGYPSKRNLIKISTILDISIDTLLIEQVQDDSNNLKLSVKYAVVSYVLIFAMSIFINSYKIDYTNIIKESNGVIDLVKDVLSHFIQNNIIAIPPAIIIGCVFYFYIFPKNIVND